MIRFLNVLVHLARIRLDFVCFQISEEWNWEKTVRYKVKAEVGDEIRLEIRSGMRSWKKSEMG